MKRKSFMLVTGILAISYLMFGQSILFNKLASAKSDKDYALASELVDLTFNKDLAYQNYLKYGILPAKEKFENNPKFKEYSSIILNALKETMDACFHDENTQTKLKEIYINVYMNEFSEKDIKELIDFYKTDIGQKLIRKQPIIMQKVYEMETKLGNELFSLKYQKIFVGKIDELVKKGELPKSFK